MARERNLVADLGGRFVQPRVGCVRHHFAADECFDAAGFKQRHLFRVAQVGVRLVFHDILLAVYCRFVEAVERIGPRLARLVDFADDRRRGFYAPANGAKDKLQFTRGEFDFQFRQRFIHALTKDVVVFKQLFAEFLSQCSRGFDKTAVAFPGPGIEKLFLFLLRQSLLRRCLLFGFLLIIAAAPFVNQLFECNLNTGEVFKERLA